MEANDNYEFVFEKIWDGGKCVGTMTFCHDTENMNYTIAQLYADGLAVRPKEGP
jgi:hypothetical protein